jgi:Zn-dependent peptidase ImmA (M78 family)
MTVSSRAQEKAQALRQQYGLGPSYVDVFDVLRRRGIEVYRRSFPGDGLEGALTIRDGVAFIFVNSQGALTRQRLTAAHELGHYELGERRDGTEVFEGMAAANGDADEWDAFRFARHFLMDEQGVRQLMLGMRDEEQRVAAVASHFVVSPTVAAIHLAELNIIRPATKARIKQGFDDGSLKAAAFLARYGYRMNDLFDSATELDPGHWQRSLDAYREGLVSLPALAEALMLSEDETRGRLQEAGIEPLDEEAPAELAAEA